jgi:hypothetical protein
MAKKRRIPLSLRLSPEVHSWICTEAQKSGVTRSGLILKAVDCYRFQTEPPLIDQIRRAVREELAKRGQ